MGRTSLGLLFIDLFFLPDNLRGGGLGSRLLRLAEEEARRRGYRVLGTVPCLPTGTSRIFMTKALT
jgi:GNAT superfamily N-acetyltransferase